MIARVEDQLQLAATATAVSCARVFVRATLPRWGASRILDDAVLVTSELVTNAVRATGITEPNPVWSRLASLSLLTVRLVGLDASVVVEVWDASLEQPVIRHASADDRDGRGLRIVERLSSRWGSYPYRGGKVVWAELAAYPREEAERGGLDSQTLTRVREGLQRL
jgi:anti-sigma regulatory factor (Ser/Thr protein kinase)